MYETPKLISAGKTTNVILGIASFGGDLDGQMVMPDFEFAQDDSFTDELSDDRD